MCVCVCVCVCVFCFSIVTSVGKCLKIIKARNKFIFPPFVSREGAFYYFLILSKRLIE